MPGSDCWSSSDQQVAHSCPKVLFGEQVEVEVQGGEESGFYGHEQEGPGFQHQLQGRQVQMNQLKHQVNEACVCKQGHSI